MVTRELRLPKGPRTSSGASASRSGPTSLSVGGDGRPEPVQTICQRGRSGACLGKLIAEKTRKGYLEYTSDAAVGPPAPERQSNAEPQSKTGQHDRSPRRRVSPPGPGREPTAARPERENLDAPPREIALEPATGGGLAGERSRRERAPSPRLRPRPRARANPKVKPVRTAGHGTGAIGVEPSLTPKRRTSGFAAMTTPFKEISRNRKKITRRISRGR